MIEVYILSRHPNLIQVFSPGPASARPEGGGRAVEEAIQAINLKLKAQTEGGCGPVLIADEIVKPRAEVDTLPDIVAGFDSQAGPLVEVTAEHL